MARKSFRLSRLLSLLLAPIWFCTLVLGTRQQSKVEFTDNGYKNLLVAISPSVSVDQADVLLENIQKMINEASPILYKATENWAYFQSVRILIPPSWTDINATLSTWESFDSADVVIDSPNSIYGDTPYTIQPGGCGERGEKIHLTPNYVATIDEESNRKQHGKPGKVFVHEWAHYRYGIFNEYGSVDDPLYPLFVTSNPPQPNVCIDELMQKPTFEVIDTNGNTCSYDNITLKYPDDCRYEFVKAFKPKSSLASKHALFDSVDMFCKENNHDKSALNKHNTMCQQKSTWDIIKMNDDFKSVTKFDMNRKSSVDFQIVRPDGQRFVLVADVSLSMKDNDRIGKLGESVRAWISQDLPAGSKLGIVQFSSNAEILSNITVIKDEQSREDLMQYVPSKLESATCIVCGLETAYEMLISDNPTERIMDNSTETTVGGVIVLVTDGMSSTAYGEISTIIPSLQKDNIRVVTIAFGNDADKDVEILADLTNGKSYFVDDKDTSADIQEAFQGALTYQPYVMSSDLLLMLFRNTTESGARKLEGSFTVDPSVGSYLTLNVYNVTKANQIKHMKLIGPGAKVFNKMVFNTNMATVTVPNTAQTGSWSLVVELNPPVKDSVLVTVTTRPLPNNDRHLLKTRCWVANGADIKDPASNPVLIHAEVLKGTDSVMGAKVSAYVTKPDSTVEHIFQLHDNGTNGDTTANDGIYSHYFTKATSEGRYTVKCQIEGTPSTFTKTGFIGSTNPSNSRSKRSTETSPTGNFSRIVSAGSFQIWKPVSDVEDVYPPAQVTDLTVSLVNYSDSNVSIATQWTAPGDELDSGTVSFYELVYADDAAELFNMKDIKNSRLWGTSGRTFITEDDLVAGSIQPVEAGSPQSATFQLRNVMPKMPYYVALRSVDKAKKTSKISNVAIFFVPQSPGEDSDVIVANDHFHPYNRYGEDQNVFDKLLNQMNTSTAIMTGLFLVLILGLCVSLLLAFVKRSKKNDKAYKPVRIHLESKDRV